MAFTGCNSSLSCLCLLQVQGRGARSGDLYPRLGEGALLRAELLKGEAWEGGTRRVLLALGLGWCWPGLFCVQRLWRPEASSPGEPARGREVAAADGVLRYGRARCPPGSLPARPGARCDSAVSAARARRRPGNSRSGSSCGCVGIRGL